jgi:hypothetical protein
MSEPRHGDSSPEPEKLLIVAMVLIGALMLFATSGTI